MVGVGVISTFSKFIRKLRSCKSAVTILPILKEEQSRSFCLTLSYIFKLFVLVINWLIDSKKFLSLPSFKMCEFY